MSQPLAEKPKSIALPDVPVVWATTKKAYVLTTDGELQTPPKHKAQQLLHKQSVLACHMPYTCKRLGAEDLFGFDVLELFAFVHPGVFCVPTPSGLAKALGLSTPDGPDDYPFTLLECVKALFSDLVQDPWRAKANPIEIASAMGQQGQGWSWTPFVYAALGQTYNADDIVISKSALNVWKNLPEWAEDAPPPAPSYHAVTGEEARAKLQELLKTDSGAEARPQQLDYASKMTAAFAPVQDVDAGPNTVLLEAGTGTGKTLGYLAPASVWAEKNQGAVWVSTYTKNLQRQIEQELDRVYPDPDIKDAKTAVRKGRENYLCLLNLEDTAAGAALSRHPNHAIAAGIMARWVAATPDGDLTGASFPGWLVGLLGYQHTSGLADKRGECIYSACDHYHRCFVEQAVRKSNHARMVVANHALVMIQTALSGEGEELPKRYVFDEGHHLFDAADSAFAGHLTARETRDLRRWILGAEGGKRSRARGLKRRCEDLVVGNDDAERMLQDILHFARTLTSDGWTTRLKDGKPKGPAESFIFAVYQQTYARANGRDGPYSLETETYPLNDGLSEKAVALKEALTALQKPMQNLSVWMRGHLNEHAETLDSDTRKRFEAVIAALERRGRMTLSAWTSMLETLIEQSKSDDFVDWMEIERGGGKTLDIGLYRHWVDPMRPFSAAIAPHAHGVAVTSATLRDGTGDEAQDWKAAMQRTGLERLNPDTVKEHFSSPFDYAQQTRILVINDVRKDDMDQVASAYRELFKASNGSALGLFTAISRVRAVYQRIADHMEDVSIPLYAQHVDEMDTGTLVDIFRDERQSCLIGTDAIRDGVDVPGDSLRLIVFDRVPWPRPTILHKARRELFGKKQYDDMITRLKIKQAYGRLIRRADDKGVFVMLDSMLPSRLLGAFPESVEIQRIGLKEAIENIQNFLNP
ncbi:MAG: ATP-dependent DNA helicase [Pseudomonadota bacterium]